MTGSVALDVVIGLVFIYLLYSLFATVLMEIINSILGLRARNLRYTIRRMLMDERYRVNAIETENLTEPKKFWIQTKNAARRAPLKLLNNAVKFSGKALNLKNPELFDDFYDQPSIKYLSAGGIANKPSYISPQNFEKALIDTLTSNVSSAPQQSRMQQIQQGISQLPIGSDTKKHLDSLVRDSHGDLQKFRFLLERWYDETMERSAGWFKRRVQYILMIIGFGLAVFFNANTLEIVKKLSNDADARAQMVDLAIAYSEKNNSPDQAKDLETNNQEAIDSLVNTGKTLNKDIINAQNIIGTNWNIPSHLEIITNDKDLKEGYDKMYYNLQLITETKHFWFDTYVTERVQLKVPESLDKEKLKKSIRSMKIEDYSGDRVEVCSNWYKFHHIFSRKFWGYLLTALAISLGSPFWFDLLNRLIKLRNSLKPKEQQPQGATATLKTSEEVNLMNRVG